MLCVVVVIANDAQRGRTVHVAVTHAAVLSRMRVKRAMSSGRGRSRVEDQETLKLDVVVPNNVVVVNVEMWWWYCGKKEAVRRREGMRRQTTKDKEEKKKA